MKNNLLPSIIFVVSIFCVSLVLLAGVIPLHQAYLTVAAIILTLWNGIVAGLVINQRGK